eukprot:GHVR01011978.1.p1 GENE.GHVR01011978.1~~GHVR01011978.1.p1  ORF type:complete len:438 (-),score=96.93 GHVR01011978.1:73-1350(-)
MLYRGFVKLSRREDVSLMCRLHSINTDSHFVEGVIKETDGSGFPAFANLRCGLWYLPPWFYSGICHFKSTDGHQTQFNFSISRLNMHLLDVIAEHGGCVIVDSTRRGKEFPDAFTRTIPYWISVMNTALHNSPHTEMQFHPSVPDYEAERLMSMIPYSVEMVNKVVPASTLASLRNRIKHPMVPLFVSPSGVTEGQHFGRTLSYNGSQPLVLLSSSCVERIYTDSGLRYVQGGGDDEEAWSRGLSATLFWRHSEKLLAFKDPDTLELYVDQLVTSIDCDWSRTSIRQHIILKSQREQPPPPGDTLALRLIGVVSKLSTHTQMRYLYGGNFSHSNTLSKLSLSSPNNDKNKLLPTHTHTHTPHTHTPLIKSLPSPSLNSNDEVYYKYTNTHTHTHTHKCYFLLYLINILKMFVVFVFIYYIAVIFY